MKALVIGGGGIARRHAGNLRAIHPDAEIALWRAADRPALGGDWDFAAPRIFSDLAGAVAWRPDLLFACGPAPFRLEQAAPFLGVAPRIYLEKPVSVGVAGVEAFFSRAARVGTIVQVGYNLRHTEGFARVLRELGDPDLGRLQFITAEVGQYLPDWRPGVDYREAVSGHRAAGGGALLELSHELDYTLATCGEVVTAHGLSAKRSGLDLDVEDTVKVIYQDEAGVLAGVHLDFCRRDPRRLCQWSLENGTVIWDLLAGRVDLYRPEGGWRTLFEAADDVARSYRHALEALLRGTPELTELNRQRSLKVLRLVEKIRS